MAITVTSKKFNQRSSYVLKLSETQPVFITKWGKIVSVLSNYEDYHQKQKVEPCSAELFGCPVSQPLSAEDFADFEQSLLNIRKSTQIRSVKFE